MSPDELAAYVRTLVDQAPPISDETRERIATLLRASDATGRSTGSVAA